MHKEISEKEFTEKLSKGYAWTSFIRQTKAKRKYKFQLCTIRNKHYICDEDGMAILRNELGNESVEWLLKTMGMDSKGSISLPESKRTRKRNQR